jgi:hypothetical protein
MIRDQITNGPSSRTTTIALWCLRIVAMADLLRIVLSFSLAFEGNSDKVGFADRLFGRYRVGGIRIDFAFLALSTLVLAGWLILQWRGVWDVGTRIDRRLMVATILAFLIYVALSVVRGFFYMG